MKIILRHGKANHTLRCLRNGRGSKDLQQHDVGDFHDWNCWNHELSCSSRWVQNENLPHARRQIQFAFLFQGLDPKVFNEIINSSTGRSWASEINNPVPGLNPTAPPSHNYNGGFSTALITKDLGLASSVGEWNEQKTEVSLNFGSTNWNSPKLSDGKQFTYSVGRSLPPHLPDDDV